MARDFEQIYDLDTMSDDELRDLIVQQLGDRTDLDPGTVDVGVLDGRVVVSGRVGTEQERRQIEQLLADAMGVEDFANEVVVDELTRSHHPEAADLAAADQAEADGALGESGDEAGPQAAHLTEGLEADQFGTRDVQDAVEGGRSYNPPERSIQEGIRSDETH